MIGCKSRFKKPDPSIVAIYGVCLFCNRKKRLPLLGQLVALVESVAGKSCHEPPLRLGLVCNVTHGRPSQVIGTFPPEGAPAFRFPKDCSTTGGDGLVPNLSSGIV